MTKKTCFMIHPFVDPYNNRSDIIYEPAIKSANLMPYHAGGPSSEIITDDIEMVFVTHIYALPISRKIILMFGTN